MHAHRQNEQQTECHWRFMHAAFGDSSMLLGGSKEENAAGGRKLRQCHMQAECCRREIHACRRPDGDSSMLPEMEEARRKKPMKR